MFSPSVVTQVCVNCGEPLGISVATKHGLGLREQIEQTLGQGFGHVIPSVSLCPEYVGAATSVEHMFEDGHAGSLIDEIGDAAGDESAAIARRLAAVGELDALRRVELVERRLWRTDPFEEVAAEIAAAQNISRGRAGGQIHMARALRDKLPELAEVFATGAIDYRMVATKTFLPHSILRRWSNRDQAK